MRLGQLIGIVYYEVRMHWRRRGVFMLAFFFTAALVLVGLLQYVTLETHPKLAELRGDMPQSSEIMASNTVIQSIWPVGLMFSILAIPPVLSDTVPKDRQMGVCALLGSLPLDRATYLTGKLLGTWASLLVMLTEVALVFGIIMLLIVGPYSLSVYLTTWIVGVLPVVFYTSGMSVLLATGQPNRRRAVFVGIAFIALCIAMLVTTTGSAKDMISLTRPTHLIVLQFEQMYHLAADLAQERPESESDIAIGPSFTEDLRALGMEPSRAQIPLTIAAGIGQVGLVWLIVWGWMRWKENIK
jgi:ABC-type transport system involved in multi-copper enzyme maturation permease subunit